jgi:hypothetical protein
MVTLTSDNVNEIVQSLLEYERNGGKFVSSQGDRVRSQWMHVNAQEYNKDVFKNLIMKDVSVKDGFSTTIYREGIYIQTNTKYFETRTLIVCSTLLELIQWQKTMEKTNLKILIIKGSRKTIPPSDVIIITKNLLSLIAHLKFYRIIFYYDYPNRTLFFEKSKFCYSPTQFSIIYNWQKYQTFFLKPNRTEYIKPDFVFLNHTDKDDLTFFIKTCSNTHVFNCLICLDKCQEILELSCSHQLCESCLVNITTISASKTCPYCRTSIQHSKITKIIQENKLTSSSIASHLLKLDDGKCKIFRKTGVPAKKALLKKSRIFDYAQFPEWDSSDDDKCIMIQTASDFKKEFVISICKSFFNQNRKKSFKMYVLYNDPNQIETLTKTIQQYFL